MSAYHRPSARIVLHYGDQFSVFSSDDRYCERRLFWSKNRSIAARFATAFTRWARAGCPADGSRPLSASATGVYRQRDFDARVSA